MGHGSTEKAEPNFTPLLDLVLQLVMFMMLCANFVMRETEIDIKLPEAVTAKALEKQEGEYFFLNVNEQGVVVLTPTQIVGDQKLLENADQVRVYMLGVAANEKKRTGKDLPQAVLVLRVDKLTRFEKTYAIMKACRQAGYEKVQLRVMHAKKT